jgi:hypothetical protein
VVNLLTDADRERHGEGIASRLWRMEISSGLICSAALVMQWEETVL